MDLALALALDVHADVVLANDPDADRCAVAVADPRSRTHHGPETAASQGWRVLHGDEVGALLGAYLADRRGAGGAAVAAGALASSIVSSRLLGRIAAAHGLPHAATLTGFKWIARTPDLLFGYEEALGYCVDPEHVRDKDGISAALLARRAGRPGSRRRAARSWTRSTTSPARTACTSPTSCRRASTTSTGSARPWRACGRHRRRPWPAPP